MSHSTQDEKQTKELIKNINRPATMGLVLGVLYAIIAISAFNQGSDGANNGTAEGLGTAIGMALVFPHLVVFFIGELLGLTGLFTNTRGLVLTSAILFCVAFVFMPFWAALLIPSIILCFVGASQMKK